MATLAITGFLFRSVKFDPAGMESPVAQVAAGPGRGRCQVPAVAHGLADHVACAVVPGGLDEQSADVAVAGLGDRPLGSGGTRGALRGDQADEGADAVAGEPVPVADLDGQLEPGQRADATQASQP